MPYPMLENVSGDYCIYNGQKISLDSDTGKALFLPISDIIYYESLRIQDGILLFFENHMTRLLRSVEAKENFNIDTERLYDLSMRLISESEPRITEGNLRIVITKNSCVIHFSDSIYPADELFTEGIVTSTMPWERREPQIKVFRDDYKNAVYNKMREPTPFGLPYEVLLLDHEGKVTEGGRSNFFVLQDGIVYSPPESVILIGITRKYVLQAIKDAGFQYREGTFSVPELLSLQNADSQNGRSFGLFVTSSPFDILPIRTVDDAVFASAQCRDLQLLRETYANIVDAYILSRKSDLT